jgi:hypothetical protein
LAEFNNGVHGIVMLSAKHTLAIAGLVFDLVGAFFLAVPMLFGVDDALRSLLRRRSRLRRLMRRAIRPLSRHAARRLSWLENYPGGISIGTDVKPDEFNLNPFVAVLAVILLALWCWYHFDYVASAYTAPYKTIENFIWWIRYPLAALEFGGEFFISLAAIAMFTLGFLFLVTLLLFVPFMLTALAAFFLSIPARILIWVLHGKERQREKKIGQIGFGVLIFAFVIQAMVNLMS